MQIYMIELAVQLVSHHLMVYSVQDWSACSNSAVHDDCDVCRAMWNNRDNNLEASGAIEQMKHVTVHMSIVYAINVVHAITLSVARSLVYMYKQ